MKYTTASTFAFAFGISIVVAACAGSDEVTPAPREDSQTADSSKDAGGPTPEPVKECPSSCSSDSECANSCPASGGTPCCDLSTKTCFNSKEAVCPKADDDAGTNPLPY